ncbi:MAG TPA: cysteine desulfurase family protein [Membranihabitans sp.]|nr:cysteine desulfurase family protein [Membranihabitans sp.]
MNAIYLDNAASAPILDEVVDVVAQALKDFDGNPSSTHKYGRKARAAIEQARKNVAKHLGASIGEIFFTSCGTEANNTVLNCAVDQHGVERIITSSIEHPSVRNSAQFLSQYRKVEWIELPVSPYGRIDLSMLEQHLKASSAKTLVSIMHANNEIGTIQPIEQIGETCRNYQALFHTDAVQSMGHLPIDTEKNYISFLSASGHKFHGPKGVGFLYVNNDNIIEPYIRGGSQERNVRAGTENVAGIVGMAHALSYCYEHLEKIADVIKDLRNYLIDRMEEQFPQTELVSYRSSEDCLYTIVNFHFPKSPKSDLMLMNLDIAGISASGGSACSSGAEKPSHVIEALDRYASEGKCVRFSLSFLNTREEIDRLIEVLKKCI